MNKVKVLLSSDDLRLLKGLIERELLIIPEHWKSTRENHERLLVIVNLKIEEAEHNG